MKVTPGWPCSFMTSASGIVSIWLSASSTICWTDFLISSGIELPPMPICTFRPRQVEALESETTDFEILAREAELREALLEVIGEQRLAQQIGGGAVVVLPLRLVAQVVPVLQRTVATTKPQSATRSACSSSLSALMKATSSFCVRSSECASSTDATPSSAALEPESGSVTTSWTSNSRALTMMKQTLSDEMVSVGSAIAHPSLDGIGVPTRTGRFRSRAGL